MSPLRIAVLGCGFWSRFQIPAWLELPDVKVVAVSDPVLDRAQAMAERFRIPGCYQSPESLIEEIHPDVFDIITSPETHPKMVAIAATHRIPAICQKPLASDFATALAMVDQCRSAGIPLFVHENFRWQLPIRELHRVLQTEQIGSPFRARIDFNSSFPVFENQPSLKELDQFILADLGVHILDVVRFLFGEATNLLCHTRRIQQDIKGEDVATLLLEMEDGMAVTCNLSFASRTEYERFPETYIFIEGEQGSIELGPDFWIRVTTKNGTQSKRYPSPLYSWADPSYALVHASIVECHRNLLEGLRGSGTAETTGVDNLRTLQLVYGAYKSALLHEVIATDRTELSKYAN
ncbi:MAG: Gfo/Idh/MocA family oxidoreductase [Verrucomicrobia bacterium]|nr:Gfo/Idh/MocA family oxidoreductase [Verrucomicrobiota bacterium]